MRKLWEPRCFQFQTPKARGVQGPLYAWRDDRADVVFITIGVRRPAYHRWIGDGIGIRFDERTHECIGFVIVVGFTDTQPVALPFWVVLTLMSDALPADLD